LHAISERGRNIEVYMRESRREEMTHSLEIKK
jgi:hypothetical protein